MGMEQAFSELYQILEHCSNEVSERIPEQLKEFLWEKRDPDWKGSLDFSVNLTQMNMLDETRALVSLVYRDFLCSKEERDMLIEKDRIETEAAGFLYQYESLLDILGLN